MGIDIPWKILNPPLVYFSMVTWMWILSMRSSYTNVISNTKGKIFFREPLFFKIFCRTRVLFVGPLTPQFCTSGDVCPGFQSQGGFPHLRVSLPVHNRFLRFTSGATPTDLLVAGMAASRISSMLQCTIFLQPSFFACVLWNETLHTSFTLRRRKSNRYIWE